MILFNSNLLQNPKIVSGHKQWLIDDEGVQLFDCWLGSGSLLFGHEGHTLINTEMLPEGISIDPKFRELLSELVDFRIGGLGLQTSGSSAVTRALRVARALTGRQKVAVIADFWHGSDGDLLFKGPRKKMTSGIPDAYQSDMDWFANLRDFFSLNKLTDYAALLAEPHQGSDPSRSVLDELTEDNRSCLRGNGVLLVLDEMITGFREQYGSCRSSRRFDPDIVIFGKALALGYPVGMVLVNEKQTKGVTKYPFWGGTFSASPTQMTRIRSSLIRLKDLDYSLLGRNHEILEHRLSKLCAQNGYIVRTGGGFSRVLNEKARVLARGFLADDLEFKELQRKFFHERIYLANNALVFPSVYNINETLELL